RITGLFFLRSVLLLTGNRSRSSAISSTMRRQSRATCRYCSLLVTTVARSTQGKHITGAGFKRIALDAQALFCRRRHQPRRPAQAASTPVLKIVGYSTLLLVGVH